MNILTKRELSEIGKEVATISNQLGWLDSDLEADRIEMLVNRLYHLRSIVTSSITTIKSKPYKGLKLVKGV